jgi:hypothetical protein
MILIDIMISNRVTTMLPKEELYMAYPSKYTNMMVKFRKYAILILASLFWKLVLNGAKQELN